MNIVFQIGVDEGQAAFLLQKTLRGRAVQLRIKKGRARKQDLIGQMRIEHPITEDEAKEVNFSFFLHIIYCA